MQDTKPFSLKQYIEQKRSNKNVLILQQRLQINLTREVEYCQRIEKNENIVTLNDVKNLWKRMELFSTISKLRETIYPNEESCLMSDAEFNRSRLQSVSGMSNSPTPNSINLNHQNHNLLQNNTNSSFNVTNGLNSVFANGSSSYNSYNSNLHSSSSSSSNDFSQRSTPGKQDQLKNQMINKIAEFSTSTGIDVSSISTLFANESFSIENDIVLNSFFSEYELEIMRTFPIPIPLNNIKQLFNANDVYIENGKIQKGSIAGIVNIGSRDRNNEIMQTLIWTNDLYSNNTTLLKCIIDCYETSCLSDDTELQISRSRILGSLKYWVESCLFDDDFVNETKRFVQRLIHYGMITASKNLQTSLENRLKNIEKKYQYTNIVGNEQILHYPPMLHFDEETDLCFFSPKEIAQQLTVMGYDLFSKINLTELLSWNDQNKSTQCVAILKLTEFSNRIVQLFVTKILNEKRLKERINFVKFLCDIGIECERLHNYDLLCCLSFTFNKSSIHRLKKTFGGLKEEHKSFMKRLFELTSPEKNWIALRNALQQDENTIHAMPYMGYLLSDITFINEGNKSTFGNGVINYMKCRMLKSVAQKIYNLQQIRYNDIATIELVQNYLTYQLNKVQIANERELDEIQYSISRTIEPAVKQPLTTVDNSRFKFLTPSNKFKFFAIDDRITLQTFVSNMYPTITPYVTFMGINNISFIGFDIDTTMNFIPPADYFTIFFKPKEVVTYMYTQKGWLKTKVCIDMSRPVITQINAFFTIMVDKHPFALIRVSEDHKERKYIDMNFSLTENGFDVYDFLLVYPTHLMMKDALGYNNDSLMFEGVPSYYSVYVTTNTLNILEREILTVQNTPGIPSMLMIGSPYIYIYQNDQLVRLYPLQFIKRMVYPTKNGIILVLKINIPHDDEITKPIAIRGDETILFTLIERIDMHTYPFQKYIMGVPLEMTLTREKRRIPLFIEQLISSIATDKSFLKNNTFDVISYTESTRANYLDGKRDVTFSTYPLSQRINILFSMISSLPEPLIPFELYDNFIEITKYPEQLQLSSINQYLKMIGVSSSLLSAFLFLLHDYIQVYPDKLEKLYPFIPVLLRTKNNTNNCPMEEKEVFNILISNVNVFEMRRTEIQRYEFVPVMHQYEVILPDKFCMNKLLSEELTNLRKQNALQQEFGQVFCKLVQPKQQSDETNFDRLKHPEKYGLASPEGIDRLSSRKITTLGQVENNSMRSSTLSSSGEIKMINPMKQNEKLETIELDTFYKETRTKINMIYKNKSRGISNNPLNTSEVNTHRSKKKLSKLSVQEYIPNSVPFLPPPPVSSLSSSNSSTSFNSNVSVSSLNNTNDLPPPPSSLNTQKKTLFTQSSSKDQVTSSRIQFGQKKAISKFQINLSQAPSSLSASESSGPIPASPRMQSYQAKRNRRNRKGSEFQIGPDGFSEIDTPSAPKTRSNFLFDND